MPTSRNVCLAALATSLIVTALPHAAGARGGMHGRRGPAAFHAGGQMGIATLHALRPGMATPHALSPLATPAPGGRQTTTPQPPFQAPAGAAAAIAGIQTTAIPATPLPASAIGAPAPQATPIAPLSPVPAPIIESSGGPVRTDTVASTTVGSASPSESAPSIAGGGGDTLAACMGFWDRGTHMTKVEWRAACTRTLNRLDLHTPVP